MKKGYFTSGLISSIFITIVLLNIMFKTPSPKIIFVPFLICSITMAGKNLSLLLGKNKLGILFSKLYAVGFLLFWFGFLVFAAYNCIRDENYQMLLFTIPLWFVGIYFAKNRFFNTPSKNTVRIRFSLGIIMSIVSVLVCIVAGIMLLIRGIITHNFGILFMGGFFTFGAFTFVLGALTIKGCFDKCAVDVLGLYIGILFTLIGGGIIAMIYQQNFGLWIIIPILMVIAGGFQIIKSLRRG